MLLRITRGLGGRKGLMILILTGAIGVLLLWLGIRARHGLVGPKGVAAVKLSEEQVIALGDKARGKMPGYAFRPGDMARVDAFAVGKQGEGTWSELAAGTILEVIGVQILDGETWVNAFVQRRGKRSAPLLVHESFLDRYQPVVLERSLEVSNVRLVHETGKSGKRVIVSGLLRNITTNAMPRCIVECIFQDRAEREADVQRSTPLDLPPMDLVQFQAPPTTKPYASIAIQVAYGTPDGLRHYFPVVVVTKSSLE